MQDVYNAFSLTGVAGALAQSIGIDSPRQSEEANPQILNLVNARTESGTVDRLFLYNPDAVSHWLYQKYTSLFNDVVKHTQLSVPLRTVMPSVTPVCFGTFYTGAQPAVHGIQRYEKPVIRIDTLFDAAIRCGKKPCILATAPASLGHIFLERDMDYFLYDTVDEVNAKAMELIDEDRYDITVVYNGNYDSAMHKNGTEAEVSISALKDNVAAFDRFATAIEQKWSAHDTLIAFAMDHGSHDIDGNCGSHGLDMPEDLNILHHYGVVPRKK